jgi:A/G-specific adenine glycosylase
MSQFSFSDALLTWFDQHGRHDLPWQVADDPYKVWVSEIMLQQTQVKTVLQYFDKFIQRFPTVDDLGQASWDDVAPYWAGLGYYARARNLHKAARVVSQQGHFPNTLEQWMELSGIGRSTAGALMSLGLRQYGVIMDGNVKRVLSRFFGIEDDLSKPVHEREMWKLAESLCPTERNHDYTQAIMDLGATVCTPKKPVPVKTGKVLLIESQGQWLWEQRPNSGLWGGLWSLPILESEAELQQICERLKLVSNVESVQISHSFTHFTWILTAHIIHVEKDQAEYLQAELGGEWLTPQKATQMGIPTAMKKLISAIKI